MQVQTSAGTCVPQQGLAAAGPMRRWVQCGMQVQRPEPCQSAGLSWHAAIKLSAMCTAWAAELRNITQGACGCLPCRSGHPTLSFPPPCWHPNMSCFTSLIKTCHIFHCHLVQCAADSMGSPSCQHDACGAGQVRTCSGSAAPDSASCTKQGPRCKDA